MEKNRNLGPLLIILSVLLIALGWNYVKENGWPRLPWSPKSEVFTVVTELYDGRVVKGFPGEFLTLAKDTKVEKSAIYLAPGSVDGREVQVLSTTYSTKASIAELFAVYIDFLNQNGYTVVRSSSVSGISNIDAKNSKSVISISIYVSTANTKEVRIDVRGT